MEKITLSIRGGISNQGPKLSIFAASFDSFLFGSLKPGGKIRLNPCNGIFSKRPKLYVSCFSLTGFDESAEKITLNIRSGILIQKSKIFIFSTSCDNSLFGSFGPEVNIRLNQCDGIFYKRPKLNLSSFKLVNFVGHGKKITLYKRDGISNQGPKISIFRASSDTFLFRFFWNWSEHEAESL